MEDQSWAAVVMGRKNEKKNGKGGRGQGEGVEKFGENEV